MKTPLQQDIDAIIRVTVLAVVVIGGPVVMDFLVRVLQVAIRWLSEPLSRAFDEVYGGYPLQETVRAAAVVVALVPQGLALLIVVTYAMAAARLAGRGTLVQQANAIESLAHVDVLCLDKTGTLTTNRLTLEEVHAIGVPESEVRRVLSDVVASMGDRNRTAAAIAAELPGHERAVREEVRFASDRKWSGLTIDDEALCGTFVLGAPEALAPSLTALADTRSVQDAWVARGRRVLLLAYRPDSPSLSDARGEPMLPTSLVPLGLIALMDELRPEAGATLRRFAELGVRLKLISGDEPRAVAALVRQAGFPISGPLVSGLDLGSSDDPGFADAARDGVIFGRTTPEQKEAVVRALRAQGHYVAMIGDGVNDILSLKQADLGIAMRSGSDATRGVADLVLLDDSFASLPAALREGQRIVAAMHNVVSLFLIRSLFVMAVIVGAALLSAPFPVTPKTSALLALVSVGIPTMAIAVWAGPVPAPGRLIRSTMSFVLPASLTMAPLALTLYLAWWRITDDLAIARTVLALTGTLCGLFLIPYAQTPSPAQVGRKFHTTDRRPMVLSVALLGFTGIVIASARLRSLFGIAELAPTDAPMILGPVLLWALFLRWGWRVQLFRRLFGLKGA